VKKVIFVNGTARCGSTMVDLILGNDVLGFSLGEVASWFRPWRTHHFDIKCGCGVYPCPVWEKLRYVPESELYGAVARSQNVEFVVDSSKSLTWVIDQNLRLASSNEFEVFNIFLYKDPVALHHSHWKRGAGDTASTARHYGYYSNALDAQIPFVTVNYDWFVRNMDEGLALLCQRLDVPYFEGKERFWQKSHHHLFGSFGPRMQMFTENPRIYVEEFGAEYESLIPGLQREFQAIQDLQRILSEMQARDLREYSASEGVKKSRVRRPLFYFRQRWRERKMRFFPQPWPDREASAIQEWRI
jgi:hypothetical protein